jgi:hypothetical protein
MRRSSTNAARRAGAIAKECNDDHGGVKRVVIRSSSNFVAVGGAALPEGQDEHFTSAPRPPSSPTTTRRSSTNGPSPASRLAFFSTAKGVHRHHTHNPSSVFQLSFFSLYIKEDWIIIVSVTEGKR